MDLKSWVKIALFEAEGRSAEVVRDREEGYAVCKTDPVRFAGSRITFYPTRIKAIKAAKWFIKNAVVWTKGRLTTPVRKIARAGGTAKQHATR